MTTTSLDPNSLLVFGVGLALHVFSKSEPKRQELSGILISLSCSSCEGNHCLHENLDTDQAPFRLALGIFLVCGGLLEGVVVGVCVGGAFTVFVSGWFRSSHNLVVDRSLGEHLTQITPGVRALRLVTSDGHSEGRGGQRDAGVSVGRDTKVFEYVK